MAAGVAASPVEVSDIVRLIEDAAAEKRERARPSSPSEVSDPTIRSGTAGRKGAEVVRFLLFFATVVKQIIYNHLSHLRNLRFLAIVSLSSSLPYSPSKHLFLSHLSLWCDKCVS
jgi:hypothetical protein